MKVTRFLQPTVFKFMGALAIGLCLSPSKGQASHNQVVEYPTSLQSPLELVPEDIFSRIADLLDPISVNQFLLVSKTTKEYLEWYIQAALRPVLHDLITIFPEVSPSVGYHWFEVFKKRSFKLPSSFGTPLPVLVERSYVDPDYLFIRNGNPILAYANSQVDGRYELIRFQSLPLLLTDESQGHIFGTNSHYADPTKQIITHNLAQFIDSGLYRHPEADTQTVYDKVEEKIIEMARSIYQQNQYVEYSEDMILNTPNTYVVMKDTQLNNTSRNHLNTLIGNGHLNLVLDVNETFLNAQGALVMNSRDFPACSFSLYLTSTNDNVRVIGNSFASRCLGLTKLILNKNLQTVGDFFASECTDLTELILNDNLETVGGYFASGCTDLTELILNENLQTVGNFFASYCTGLTKLIMNKNLQTVGKWFAAGCTNLKTISVANEEQIEMLRTKMDPLIFDAVQFTIRSPVAVTPAIELEEF